MRRVAIRVLAVVLIAVLGASVWLYLSLTRHADLARYVQSAPGQVASSSEVKVTFLGTTTLLFDDGETQIMTDGFFTRPDPVQLFTKRIASDPGLIDQALGRANVHRLAALVVLHSHYDHAMDTAAVANKTGAVVVGSTSTANVARGGDVPEDHILTPAIGETLVFGKFKVTLLRSQHVPTGYPNGTIDSPLRQPVRADAYRLGNAYAALIEHGGKSILANGSAGYEPNALAGHRVETIFLAIGILGKQSPGFLDEYWRNVVEATNAKHVVVTHWDNFALPLNQPLQPLPKLFDDLETSMRSLETKGHQTGVRVLLPQGWQVFDAFNP